MIVQHIYSNLNSGHYSCTIPWKRDGTNLVNNINEVLARQRRTNSSYYLVKKCTSLTEIDKKNPKIKLPNDTLNRLIERKKKLIERTITFLVIFQ